MKKTKDIPQINSFLQQNSLTNEYLQELKILLNSQEPLDITPIKFQSQLKNQGESFKKNLNLLYSNQNNYNYSSSPKINQQNQEDSDKSRGKKENQKQDRDLNTILNQIQKPEDDIPKFVFLSAFSQSTVRLNKNSQQINLSNEKSNNQPSNSKRDSQTNMNISKNLLNTQNNSNDWYLKLKNDQNSIEIKINNCNSIPQCNLKKLMNDIKQQMRLLNK
ncbi:hypothetical protein ABPG74_017810 [Tetrahymena malaccensis]